MNLIKQIKQNRLMTTNYTLDKKTVVRKDGITAASKCTECKLRKELLKKLVKTMWNMYEPKTSTKNDRRPD